MPCRLSKPLLRRILLALGLWLPLLVLGMLPAAPALAQMPAAGPSAAAPAPASEASDAEALQALLRALEDPVARERLAGRIRDILAVEPEAAPEAEPGALGARALDFLSNRLNALGQQFGAIGAAFADLPLAIEWFEGQLTEDYRRGRWAELLLQLAGAIIAGFLASALARFLLRRPREAIQARSTPGFLARLPLLTGRTLLDLVPIGAFALAGYGMLSIADPPGVIRLVALTVINATILVQLVMIAARALLAPHLPNLRLIRIDDETAHYLYIWLRRLAYTGVYGYLASQAAFVLGLPAGAYLALLKLVGLVVTAMVVILILQNRADVASWMRGHTLSGSEGGPAEEADVAAGRRSAALRTARRRLADIWHILAILYVVVIYGIWALNVAGGFEFMLRATLTTVAVLVGARVLVTILNRLVRRGFEIAPEVRQQYPNLEQRANRYLPILQRGLTVVVWVGAILILLDAWGIDSLAWLDTPGGQRLIGSLLSIGLILLIAIIAWELVSAAIERYLTGATRNGAKVERSARIRTLLPLLRNAFLVLLVAIVSLTILAEIGVDIGPLLAGAGVIGLAIGFGSQTLVKDVITGLFILIEDTVSVGDVVDVGNGHSGLVEAMSIRTLRLRDLAGSVHSIPFSQVATVKNLTKDFSFYVFDIGVAYHEDPDRVIEVVKELGAEMQADPDHGHMILEPIEIMGVDAFRDSAVVIKARFKTRPSLQWSVGREFNRRLKHRFDELGIEIPFPQRTVHIRSEAMPSPQLLALAGGAPQKRRRDRPEGEGEEAGARR